MSTPNRLQRLLGPGFEAARESWRPFLLIQIGAAGLVALYYLWPPFHAWANQIEQAKVAGGPIFVFVSTVFATVVLPETARRLTRSSPSSRSFLAFQVAFFGTMGLVIDLLYRSLGQLLGSKVTVQLVVEKVVIDQFVFSPFFSIPISTLLFAWQADGFSFTRTRETLAGRGFALRYFPLLATCWCYWGPLLCAMYALPVGLQFLLFLCANAAWNLLLVGVTRRRN